MTDLAPIKDSKPPRSGFSLQPANMDQAMKMADMLANSNMVPKNYKAQPGDTLIAMMMGAELGLNPIQSLQNIATINGRPAIYGDAMLALVQNRPSFESIDESFDDATMTATCTVKRKGGKPHTQTFSQSDATTAGLWNKQGPWTTNPKRMLAMRARGFALRNQFADALLGLITAEEAYDYPVNTNTGEIIEHAKVIEESPVDDGYYPQDQFEKNFPAWEEKIQSGAKTATEIINFIDKKKSLSDDQKKRLEAVKVVKP